MERQMKFTGGIVNSSLRRYPLWFIFFFVNLIRLNAEVLPHDGAVLNYRLIGFSIPAETNAPIYTLEISRGNITDEAVFKNNIIAVVQNLKPEIIAEVPEFGKDYTWRISYAGKNSKNIYSPLYHFATGRVPAVDTSVIRLRITQKSEQYKYSCVLLDGSMVLYDMNGNPLWYFPKADTFKDPGNHRDLKITKAGTLTFITSCNAYEISCDGRVLWQAPNDGKVSGDSQEHYHHELTRLSNGHYMLMGSETKPVFIKVTETKNRRDSCLFTGDMYKGIPGYIDIGHPVNFGTIIEYNSQGDAVWSYKTTKYFTGSDLIHRRLPNGEIVLKAHDNSFYLDEEKHELYISFRDLSRVIKLRYPDGELLNTYGEILDAEHTGSGWKQINNGMQIGNDLFCAQHSCRCSHDGYLYLFNNNTCHPGSMPALVVMQQPPYGSDSLKKIWEYECELEPGDLHLKGSLNFTSGGNVEELPDGSFFASMGGGYSKVFIVNREKKVIWSAMAERWNAYERKWEMIPQYRASIITDRKELERLIWKGERN